MRQIILTLFAIFLASTAAMAETTAYDFTLTGIDGKPMPLSQFKGHPMLIVNTASECGYTPQYEDLEKLWLAYKDKGLVIIGVPSNDFGSQEPGTSEEIATFCKVNYGVTFPLADKTVVKGDKADPFYKWAGEQAGVLGRPKWNFHKYLISAEGRFIDWFSTPTKPMGPKITAAVDKALATK
ncbi:MAG: glutathione peroxidase [Aestuariivirga sp.]|uniref:glutathione peroxidase n=1 Tax=Aestuariivirga sp. TaxID=2650926 RepID=UPI0030193384